MSKTEIVNGNEEDCDVWIDRRSRFGNPFPISDAPDSFPDDVKRKYVIHLYKTWFDYKVEHDSEFAEAVEDLRGNKLGCHCKPKPCHGDVIREYLEDPLRGQNPYADDTNKSTED